MYLAKVVDVVQCLQQRVHVACCTLVLQTNIACGFLAVIVVVLLTVNPDNHIEAQSVINKKAFFRGVGVLLGDK